MGLGMGSVVGVHSIGAMNSVGRDMAVSVGISCVGDGVIDGDGDEVAVAGGGLFGMGLKGVSVIVGDGMAGVMLLFRTDCGLIDAGVRIHPDKVRSNTRSREKTENRVWATACFCFMSGREKGAGYTSEYPSTWINNDRPTCYCLFIGF